MPDYMQNYERHELNERYWKLLCSLPESWDMLANIRDYMLPPYTERDRETIRKIQVEHALAQELGMEIRIEANP